MHCRSGKAFTVMAVASGGGHWEELMLLRPGLEAFSPIYATTTVDLALRDGIENVHPLPDSNRDQPLRAVKCLWHSFRLICQIKPDVLITTGALPGLFCLISARLFGAHTIWVDSVANSDQPSLSGKLARPFTRLWLTQWEYLAQPPSTLYRGGLL